MLAISLCLSVFLAPIPSLGVVHKPRNDGEEPQILSAWWLPLLVILAQGFLSSIHSYEASCLCIMLGLRTLYIEP